MRSSYPFSTERREPSLPSYFDLCPPIPIPIDTTVHNHHHHWFGDMEESTYNEHGDDFLDGICPPDLPEYLKSFSGTGISDARLKQFNWLHPRNYSGQGSLSEADTLSPYGTSVSSPRGDEWELVDHGPRKSIDELWDEAFEYRQRIKALEQQQMAAEAAELLESILMTSEYGACAEKTKTKCNQPSTSFLHRQRQRQQQRQHQQQQQQHVSDAHMAGTDEQDIQEMEGNKEEAEPLCCSGNGSMCTISEEGEATATATAAAYVNMVVSCPPQQKHHQQSCRSTYRSRELMKNSATVFAQAGSGDVEGCVSNNRRSCCPLTQTYMVTIQASRKGCRTDRGMALQLLRSL